MLLSSYPSFAQNPPGGPNPLPASYNCIVLSIWKLSGKEFSPAWEAPQVSRGSMTQSCTLVSQAPLLLHDRSEPCLLMQMSVSTTGLRAQGGKSPPHLDLCPRHPALHQPGVNARGPAEMNAAAPSSGLQSLSQRSPRSLPDLVPTFMSLRKPSNRPG